MSFYVTDKKYHSHQRNTLLISAANILGDGADPGVILAELPNAVHVGTLEDGMYIVEVKHVPTEIADFIMLCDVKTDMELVIFLRLGEWYIGREKEDVFKKFPELIGDEETGRDEGGNPIMRPRLNVQKWQ